MLIPRYYFAEDFHAFYKYFSSQPHEKKNFKVGEFLWQPGAPYEKIHYIISGVGMHYADHESGKRKKLVFMVRALPFQDIAWTIFMWSFL